MYRQQSFSLPGIGIRFRFGYEILPLSKLSQVLWYRLESDVPITSRALSQTYFWIEFDTGELVALVLNDLEFGPEEIIPSLANLDPEDRDEDLLVQRLRLNWLVPPHFRANHIPNALMWPNKASLWKAMKQQLSAMLGIPDLAATTEKCIDELLSNCQREMIDLNGVVIERCSCTPEHEFSPSIERLDGVAQFLDLSNHFKASLCGDILGLFDFYAPLLDARTHTIENYNTARSWSITQRRNRTQAIKAFPWLFHELGLRTGGPDCFHEPAHIATHMRPEISEAIDVGHPLSLLLAKRYKVHKHTLRYARTLLKTRYRIPECIPSMLWLLDSISPDKRPTGETEMEVLNNVIDWIGYWQLETDRVYVNEVGVTLFQNGNPGFRAVLRRYCPSHNPDSPFNDLGDFISDYVEKQDGTLITQEMADSVTKEWIKEAGLVSLLVESERWHTSWWEREIRTEHFNWRPLITGSHQIGCLVVHELSNTQLLVEEGRAMRHCIASYASLCQSGKSVIFSLRSLEGDKRRSTLHVGIDEAGRFIIREHRAFANREPDQECIDAAFQFLDTLRTITGRTLEEPITIRGVVE